MPLAQTAPPECLTLPAQDQAVLDSYIADGYSFEDYIHDETFVCEVCEGRFPGRVMDAQIHDLHPTYKHVCSSCAEPLLIAMGAA